MYLFHICTYTRTYFKYTNRYHAHMYLSLIYMCIKFMYLIYSEMLDLVIPTK